MNKHTPGPWQAVEWNCHAPTTVRAGDVTIAECSGHGRYTNECIADAILIAAAPELLRVMDLVASGLEADGRTLDGMTKAVAAVKLRAAIALATVGTT